MGLFDNPLESISELFGGKDASLKTVSALDANQQQLYSQLANYLKQAMTTGATPWASTSPTAAGYNYVGGPTAQEQSALGALDRYLASPNTLSTDLSPFLANIQRLATPGASTQSYMQNVYPALERQVSESVIPKLREAYAGTGTFSGTDRATAEQKTWTDLASNVAATLAQQEQQNALAAAGALPSVQSAYQGIASQDVQKAAAGLQYGGLERQLQTQELSARYNEFLRTNPQSASIINQVMQLLGLQTQASYMDPGSPGLLSQALSGLVGGASSVLGGLGGASLGSSLFPSTFNKLTQQSSNPYATSPYSPFRRF